ncbi:WD40 repeat-like protein [Phanerochaete sordida]|uniref:WD40 repeat-like protein n=1 Tax=Phanerochaete sordida TaxID=48140 RepID=A0A9P3GCA8_9APHY|nr:WD40 repeat-like protein [Phanerochaete sordida]
MSFLNTLATSTSSSAQPTSAASSTATMSSAPVSLKGDIQVADAPTDSVSGLAWSPTSDLLAAGSWDSSVRVYQVAPNGQTRGVAAYAHAAPVLSVAWSKDGSKLFSGGCDGAGRMLDTTTGQAMQVAQHDAPIKCVRWVETPRGGLLATGGWDKTLRYWDLRSPAPAAVIQLPERLYTMDVKYPWLVLGTADRHIQIYDLSNPTVVFNQSQSGLAMQTRVVSMGDGVYAYGNVEGRVQLTWTSPSDPSAKHQPFNFKAHRTRLPNEPATSYGSVVWAVNDISFHPLYTGTFTTCGSDGRILTWDAENRTRLATFEPAGAPVTATAFSRTGALLAYAVSYDWHRGHAGNTPDVPSRVMVHSCRDDEVKPRHAAK